MLNFYNFLRQNNFVYENFGDEDSNLFYISGYDKFRFLKTTEKNKPGDILVAYEKIKLDFKKDIYSPVNVFSVLRSYKPNTNKKELWSKKYKVNYLRFLFYKIENTLYIFTFDGSILHDRMVNYLESNKIKRHLPNIEYLILHDAFWSLRNDILDDNLPDFSLKEDNWCLPLNSSDPWRELYLIDSALYELYMNQEIYKYFGVTNEEFVSKIFVF